MSDSVQRSVDDAIDERSESEPLLRVDGLTKHFNNTSGFLEGWTLNLDGDGLPITRKQELVRAVEDVSFEIREGETLGLVGESGCGKSTLARTILRLVDPTDGDVYFKGENLAEMSDEKLRRQRKDIQMIFQDPQSSLDPRMKIGPIVEEPMRAHDLPESDPEVETTATVTNETDYDVSVSVDDDIDMAKSLNDGVATAHVTVRSGGEDADAPVVAETDEDGLGTDVEVDETDRSVSITVSVTASKAELRQARAEMLLEKVGLDPQHYNRYPHAFSGGQRQRVNLARALSVNPDFIVCDEPVSALDVSIQAQVLNTMNELQEEFGLTYLFIAHDLSVIRHISDRVAVMYLGQLVELADKEELFENPQHPYTQALLDSIPVPDPRSSGKRGVLEGDVPSPIDPPSGCRFRTRCPQLIAPGEYGLTDEEWNDVREFMRAVDRRTFQLADRDDILDRFFDGVVPSGEAGDRVDEAIDAVVAAEWERAMERIDGVADEFDLPDSDRDEIRAFATAIERQAFTPASERNVVRKFFDGSLPSGEAGDVVERAIDELLDGRWKAAGDRLTEAFAERSICANEQPAYEVSPELSDRLHYAACHLHADD